MAHYEAQELLSLGHRASGDRARAQRTVPDNDNEEPYLTLNQP